MSIELKIKSKHLSEEAKIIRNEEQKLKKQARWMREHQKDDRAVMKAFRSLHEHRRWDVRNENRATFLARAYLEGKTYSQVERKCNDPLKRDYYIVPRIVKMVSKYGPQQVEASDIRAWIKG